MNVRSAAGAAVLAVASALVLALAGSAATARWQTLPAAPVAADDGLASVWTGSELLVFGRKTNRAKDGAVLGRVDAGAAYDPAARVWRRLAQPPQTGGFMDNSAVWTGKEMLVWGQGTRLAFAPRTNRWRRLPGSPLLSVHDGHGLVVWTGREMIGWGGGCCGDAFSDGVAYSPRTDAWRATAPAPLAGSQHPIGAWTGRELIVLVGGLDPDGKPWPARLARAAAYNPATNRWRRIAAPPASIVGALAVWDGRELLVVGGGAGLAFDPGTNRWRRIAGMPSARTGAVAVWTGKRVLVWGGLVRTGLAYDPAENRWSALPASPVAGRLGPTAVWTGRSLVVWGGDRPAVPLGTGTRYLHDGAAFTPKEPS